MSRSWHHGANKPNLFPTALWCPFNFPPVKTAIHGKPGYIPDTYLTPHIGGVFYIEVLETVIGMRPDYNEFRTI